MYGSTNERTGILTRCCDRISTSGWCQVTASMTNKEKSARLAKRLYPSLATWEILLWTAGWIFAVGYSIYHVYLASKSKSNQYVVPEV